MIDFKEIFHIGIRVPNIHAAMKEMGGITECDMGRISRKSLTESLDAR